MACAAFSQHAWPELRRECDDFAWVGVLRMGQWVRVLRAWGCHEAIMVGRVRKTQMYDPWRYFRYIPDWRAARLWFTDLRHDKRPYAILQAVIRELSSAGINLMDSTTYCADQLADSGVLTRHQPNESQWSDIRFGWSICRQLSTLDIGQSIAVMDRDVIAVEALEGTNAMIERAGKLYRVRGWFCADGR